MPNDAKLGLVVGIGLVIAVAVIYFRNDAAARKQEETPAATASKPTPVPAARQMPVRGQARPTKARPAVQTDESQHAKSEPRRHTVADGDTLASLAERYYGDKDKSQEIYRVNREQLQGPDELPLGAVLLIPELPCKGDE